MAEFKAQGDACVRGGQFLEALKHYSRAIEEEPTAVLFSNRSLVQFKLRRYERAAEDAEFATRLAPEWAKPYARLFEAKRKLGDVEGAIPAIQAAIGLDQENEKYKEMFRDAMDEFKAIVDEKTLVDTFRILDRSDTGVLGFEDFKQMLRLVTDMSPDNTSEQDFEAVKARFGSQVEGGLDFESWKAFLRENPMVQRKLQQLTFMPAKMDHYDAIYMIHESSGFSIGISQAIASFLDIVLFETPISDDPDAPRLCFTASDHDPAVLNYLKKPVHPSVDMPQFFTFFLGVPDHDASYIVLAVCFRNFEKGMETVHHHLGFLENGNLTALNEDFYVGLMIMAFEYFDISWNGCIQVEISSKLERLSEEKMAVYLEAGLGRPMNVMRSMPTMANMFDGLFG